MYFYGLFANYGMGRPYKDRTHGTAVTQHSHSHSTSTMAETSTFCVFIYHTTLDLLSLNSSLNV